MSDDDPQGTGEPSARARSRTGWIIGGSVAAGIVVVAAMAAVAIAAVAITANAGPPARIVSTPSSAAEEVDRVEEESLGFDEGAALDPLEVVGWQFSLGEDDAAWTMSPDAAEGDVVFVNSDGTCTAQYWGETFDTTATDDLAATDEFLAELSGATAEEMAEYAFYGHFALTGGLTGPEREGDVAARTLLWDDGQNTFLLTTRVFHKLDFATSTMSNAYTLQVQCDIDVDPQDVVDSLDDVAQVTVDR